MRSLKWEVVVEDLNCLPGMAIATMLERIFRGGATPVDKPR